MRELLTDKEKAFLLEADTVRAADFCNASGVHAQELVIKCHPVLPGLQNMDGPGKDMLAGEDLNKDGQGMESLCCDEPGWHEKKALSRDGCYIVLSGRTAIIKVPLIHDQLRHYFDDYKNYYYLPESDEALHKSVAAFVDKSRRRQAKADDCYMKLEGSFFPVFTTANEMMDRQVFRRERRDKEAWLCLDGRTKADRRFFSDYATWIYKYAGRVADLQ